MNLWTTASEDAEDFNHRKLTATLRIESVQYWPFLAEAESEADFDNRLALIASELDRIVRSATKDGATFISARAELEESFKKDFATVEAARKQAAEKCTVCGKPATKYVGGQEGYSASGHHVCDAHADHFSKSAEYHYVKPAGGGKYKIVQKGTGKTLSVHDSKEEAKSAFRAMETHMHGGSKREDAERDSAHMVGSVCRGCGEPKNKQDGKVVQRDLGSPEKWHKECYQMYNRRLKSNPSADKYHGASKTAGYADGSLSRWGTGKTLSTHDSKEEAKSAFRAMETHMHGGSKREDAERDSAHMVGSVCRGCGEPKNKQDGKVVQRDLGSPEKWHKECYQMYNRRLKSNPSADKYHGASKTAGYADGSLSRCGACGNPIRQSQREVDGSTAWHETDGGYGRNWGDDRDYQCGISMDNKHHPVGEYISSLYTTASEDLTDDDLRELSANGNELAEAMLRIREDRNRSRTSTKKGDVKVAGEGAYVTDAHNSGIRNDVSAGTKATAEQGYQTFMGTSVYDWSVEGQSGDGWQLGGDWSDSKTGSKTSAHDPIAYTYEADIHCPECAEKRFGPGAHGTDREGNEVGAVAPWDETSPEGEHCGTCGKEIAPAYHSGSKTAETFGDQYYDPNGKPCSVCGRGMDSLSEFPGDRCISCHANSPEGRAMPTADELSRMWGGPGVRSSKVYCPCGKCGKPCEVVGKLASLYECDECRGL